MIKKGAFSTDNVNISFERRFCQEIQYRTVHYDHFHSLKNLTVEYQIFNNRFLLTFGFGDRPSYHDIGIICRLVEEEIHLLKHHMKTIGWSEKFAVDMKKESLTYVLPIITEKLLSTCKYICINLDLKYV